VAGPRRVAGPAGRPARRVTINDVAAAAGVSRQTVTRAMNDMQGISEQTKQRVLAAAGRLSYRPSRFGRGLVKREQHTLGLVIHDLTNPYYPELASAVVGFAAKQGWNVVLADTVHTSDRQAFLAELGHQVDAVVGYLDLSPCELDAALAGLPVVEIDPGPARPRRGAVLFEMAPAIAQAVSMLTAVGVHRPVMVDILHLGEPSGRAELVASALAEHGVRLTVVGAEENTVAAGAGAVDELFAGGRTFDAVFAFNDILALGALQSCRGHRTEVPGTVRVVGIDGLSVGRYVTPRLTTLAVDMAEVARHAVDLVVGMHSGDLPWSGAKVRRRVRHQLVVRESA